MCIYILIIFYNSLTFLLINKLYPICFPVHCSIVYCTILTIFVRFYFGYSMFLSLQLVFTIFLDLEALFKIWCLGFKGYFKHSYHKFELVLSIGTTIHIIPQCYPSIFTSFQVRNSLYVYI